MSFLFVDRILSLTPGKRVTGIKLVTKTDNYWLKDAAGCYHFHDAIIGETLGQLAAWSVMKALDFAYRPVAGVVGEVEVLGHASIGDTLYLEAEIDSYDETSVVYHGQVSRQGQPILRLKQALGPMLPMAEFCPRDIVINQFEQIVRLDETFDGVVSMLPDMLIENPTNIVPVGYDSVSWDQQQRMAEATLLVSKTAPFFPDHFPNKPVLPLTILLSANIELAHLYLQQFFANELYVLTALKKIKMSEFVRPGDKLVTQMNIKSQDDDRLILLFKSLVNGKRVCVSQMHFARKTDNEG